MFVFFRFLLFGGLIPPVQTLYFLLMFLLFLCRIHTFTQTVCCSSRTESITAWWTEKHGNKRTLKKLNLPEKDPKCYFSSFSLTAETLAWQDDKLRVSRAGSSAPLLLLSAVACVKKYASVRLLWLHNAVYLCTWILTLKNTAIAVWRLRKERKREKCCLMQQHHRWIRPIRAWGLAGLQTIKRTLLCRGSDEDQEQKTAWTPKEK